jgi:anaerobic selenocysteine-containing dehydrogenase
MPSTTGAGQRANVLSRGCWRCGGEPVVISPLYKQRIRLRDGCPCDGGEPAVRAWPVKVENGKVWVGNQQLLARGGLMNETRTTCPYCGVGCGVLASVDDAGRSACAAMKASGEPRPSVRQRGGAGETTAWRGGCCAGGGRPEGELAAGAGGAGERLRQIIDQHGPQAVAFYASGQLLTEDYYAANKLMKGFIGAANIDTNSRLCMSSAVTGYKRAFGEDVVPCSYEDVENSDLVVLVGSNAAWTHPVLYQRLVQAKRDNPRMKVVVIDPAHRHLRYRRPPSGAGARQRRRAVCRPA